MPILKKLAWCNNIAANTAHIRPPRNPIHDFLGEMDGNSLAPYFWPKVEPRQYAPTSVAHSIMNMQSNITPEYIVLSCFITARLHRLIGRAIYSIELITKGIFSYPLSVLLFTPSSLAISCLLNSLT